MKTSLLKTSLLLAIIIAPPSFFCVMVFRSAITVPFWDYIDFAAQLVQIYDGNFDYRDLWASHNHSRPFVMRVLIYATAQLTHWDIRLEYAYLLGCCFGAFALLSFALWRVNDRRLDHLLLLVLGLVSVLVFSPVGHNNHWWSMMIQLNLSNLLILGCLVSLSLAPDRWRGHLVAATCGWLATYTLTNGLIAMIAATVLTHLTRPCLWRLHRFTIFWLVNLVLISLLYFPGLKETVSSRAAVLDLILFPLAYLGNPVASLVRYPFRGQFDIAHTTTQNVLAGLFLLAVAGLAAWHCWPSLRARRLPAVLFFGFALFAVGSALVTAAGRAGFPPERILHANSSRYIPFASYLLYGFAFAATGACIPRAAAVPNSTNKLQRCVVLPLLLFVLFAARSYYRSMKVYEGSHTFNQMLVAAYQSEQPHANDCMLFPNVERARKVKVDLRRLGIGPYRWLVHSGGGQLSSPISSNGK
jgi:hypothetical protein